MKRTMYEAAHHTPKRKAVRSNRAGDATPAVRKSRTAGFFLYSEVLRPRLSRVFFVNASQVKAKSALLRLIFYQYLKTLHLSVLLCFSSHR